MIPKHGISHPPILYPSGYFPFYRQSIRTQKYPKQHMKFLYPSLSFQPIKGRTANRRQRQQDRNHLQQHRYDQPAGIAENRFTKLNN